MDISFQNRTNPDIDRLVNISWANGESHLGEFFRIKARDEDVVTQLVNDEEEKGPHGEEIADRRGLEPENTNTSPIDFSKLTRPQPIDEERTRPSTHRNLLIAVDSGIANLGEFVGGGQAFAVRGAAICVSDDGITVLRYNTGPLLVDSDNLIPVLRYIGKRLGNEELYLKKTTEDEFVPRQSAADTANQIQDRCRNFVERMIQEEALSLLSR